MRRNKITMMMMIMKITKKAADDHWIPQPTGLASVSPTSRCPSATAITFMEMRTAMVMLTMNSTQTSMRSKKRQLKQPQMPQEKKRRRTESRIQMKSSMMMRLVMGLKYIQKTSRPAPSPSKSPAIKSRARRSQMSLFSARSPSAPKTKI